MFRRIAVIQKPNSLKLAQVICRPLKRQLETPRKKTDAHVHVRYFVLVGNNLNIDYVVVKNKPDFIFEQKKESKTYKWRSLLRSSFCQLPIMGKLTILPNIPRTRIYTRFNGDGKGQYIFINWSRVYLSRLAKNSAKRTTDVPGPETGRSSLGDTDHHPAVIQDAFRQDGEDSAAGRLQTDRLVLRVGGHRIRHRAFPAAHGRALAA